MNLPDLKQLEKIIILCRKRGVKTIKIDNIELTLNEDIPLSNYKKAKQNNHIQSPIIESNSLSEDELLLWSVGLSEEISKDS